jgi:hypothetical protein
MKIQKMPTEASTFVSIHSHCKDTDNHSNNSVLTAKIRGLFLNGGKYTAKQLNALCGFNDSRKAISVLRANGLKILDLRLENNCKLYWLEADKKQLSLFDSVEGLQND